MKQNVPFNTFKDWSSILEKLKNIVEGEKSVQDVAKEGYEEYKKGKGGNSDSGK